jgi:hypothetical protein
MEAPSFTRFRTVEEAQDLMKKVAESGWPQNGWTATNYAMTDPHEQPAKAALAAPFLERERAYMGDWTSCERERQFVQAKLCSPPRGLPHAEDCRVDGCRGECLSVPQYHAPLPGGSGGPRSIQSQQERDRLGEEAPVYTPGVLGGVNGKPPPASLSGSSEGGGGGGGGGGMTDTAGVPGLGAKRTTTRTKRVSWEETKKRKEEVRQMKAEAARLLALQKANSTPSAATFTPPECYVATVSSEIRNVNASMPMISCPTVCIVKGACQCGSGSTG